MQQERDPLNLGSLPLVSPPSDGWPAIRDELEKRGQRRRRAGFAAGVMAAAVTLSLAIGLFTHQPEPMSVTDVVAAPQALDSMISLSQRLEVRVRDYRSGVGGMPTDALVYQVELEDLIAQVDEALSMNPESIELWGQRVNLLLDLSQLYQNQLRRDYHQIASL